VKLYKENRKIVMMKENEIKLRIKKVMGEIERIRWIKVMLFEIEDKDIKVVWKDEEIVKKIKDVMKKKGIVKEKENKKKINDIVRKWMKNEKSNLKGVYD
jgi:2-phospho-L-lactate guanylyltransferase (CobY/MobA/RfbA family)